MCDAEPTEPTLKEKIIPIISGKVVDMCVIFETDANGDMYYTISLYYYGSIEEIYSELIEKISLLCREEINKKGFVGSYSVVKICQTYGFDTPIPKEKIITYKFDGTKWTIYKKEKTVVPNHKYIVCKFNGTEWCFYDRDPVEE